MSIKKKVRVFLEGSQISSFNIDHVKLCVAFPKALFSTSNPVNKLGNPHLEDDSSNDGNWEYLSHSYIEYIYIITYIYIHTHIYIYSSWSNYKFFTTKVLWVFLRCPRNTDGILFVSHREFCRSWISLTLVVAIDKRLRLGSKRTNSVIKHGGKVSDQTFANKSGVKWIPGDSSRDLLIP